MKNILGLDLGTNSIGWAIRDIETISDNQITDSGVVVFQKGVGEGKSGEFSLAAERRTHRSKRRLYNAKRYRKWATLKVLVENQMCPLTIEELERWTKYKKEEGGRNYPSTPDFFRWLAMDFNKIGAKFKPGEKLKPEFNSPYELRRYLLENDLEFTSKTKYQIGRAFYHLTQRRGFRTSRKSGKSSFGDNALFKRFRELHPDKADWKPSQIYLYVQSKVDESEDLRKDRIRNNAVIQRIENENEFYGICQKQKLDKSLTDKIYKAIYHVRPLRTQKGLVGKCTLEKGKSRIPVSHPFYEEFRALQFVNNLKWRKTESKEPYEQLPMSVRKEIFEKLFFRVSKPHFKFDEIIERFSNKGEYEFNYRNKPNVSACPVITGIMNVFDDKWKEKFITDENRSGINWNVLSLSYKVKYETKNKEGKGLKRKKGTFIHKKTGEERNLDYEGIWHLLFDYLQTKDKEDDLIKFMMDVVGWDESKAKAFADISINQGYGSLSKTAISKILPYLRQGYIYSEAVSFANLKNVLGESFEKNKDAAIKAISQTISQIDLEKEKLNIVNGLIQQYFGELETIKAKGLDDEIKQQAKKDVTEKLRHYFGESNWSNFSEAKQNEYYDFVLNKYLAFLDGKQQPQEKASSRQGKNPEIDYYRLPRLDEAIKDVLGKKFGASNERLKKLYHPSDIEIYPPAEEKEITDELTGEIKRVKQLGDPMPPSKGWKNPMAMRTMHELKKLLNYLLITGKIDEETKVVVEMARELNDANKRWAIQTWQKRREDQNIEFAKVIIGLAKEKYPNLNENDADNIDKVRLWWEQLDNGDEIYKQVKALKENVQKYRLWREQECRCMYTGRMINLVDLFDGTKTDFEHTLPIGDSFDNSLANLTVCDSEYNRKIKKDKIPYDCPNYENDSHGYPAIKPRLKNWIEKAESLKERIEKNKIATKGIQDIKAKNESIQRRHLLQFEFDYWNKKVKTFTVKEVPNWWKNSQLVDTQIITKYARAYLKSLFRKVEVQKGSITAEFRKIYGIMGDEKKDRSKHSHHAVDAAVLTLIPGSARREAILKEYYEALEHNKKYHRSPYETFNVTHVKDIENSILINHITKDQTLADTKKKARRRGRIVYLKDKKTKKYLRDKKGRKIVKELKGDNVRGQLHKETFFGAIKVVERDNSKNPKKDEHGNYIFKKDKSGNDLIRYVVREPLVYKTSSAAPGFKDLTDLRDQIVDPILFKMIKDQVGKKEFKKALEEGIWMINKRGEKENRIRHVRIYCSVNPYPIKKHREVFKSKHEYKHDYYADLGDNSFYLLYEGMVKKKIRREYKVYKLFDVAALKRNTDLHFEKEFFINENTSLPLRAIIKTGTKLLLYKESADELKDLDQQSLLKRLVIVKKFRADDGRIYFQNHLEARSNDEIKKDFGEYSSQIDFNNPKPWNVLSRSNFNFIIEGERNGFKITPDGKISWNPVGRKPLPAEMDN